MKIIVSAHTGQNKLDLFLNQVSNGWYCTVGVYHTYKLSISLILWIYLKYRSVSSPSECLEWRKTFYLLSHSSGPDSVVTTSLARSLNLEASYWCEGRHYPHVTPPYAFVFIKLLPKLVGSKVKISFPRRRTFSAVSLLIKPALVQHKQISGSS